jgi:hypothetical protein
VTRVLDRAFDILEALADDGHDARRIEWAEIGNGRGSENKGKG